MNTNSRGTVIGPLFLQRLVDLEGLAAAVLARRDAVGDGADAVVEDRPVDEARPDVQRVDQLAAAGRLKPQVS